MGKPEGKRPLVRPRYRWEDGIRMDLREIGWGSVDWIQLAQDRDWWWALVNTVMKLRVLAPRSYKKRSKIFTSHTVDTWRAYVYVSICTYALPAAGILTSCPYLCWAPPY
jgi:hypothetical protein